MINNKKILYRISVSEHLHVLKSIGNKVAALTGKGTVIIINMETYSQEGDMQSYEYREMQEVQIEEDDQITTLEWLKEQSTS